jgi:hypothetical protein
MMYHPQTQTVTPAGPGPQRPPDSEPESPARLVSAAVSSHGASRIRVSRAPRAAPRPLQDTLIARSHMIGKALCYDAFRLMWAGAASSDAARQACGKAAARWGNAR